MKNIFKYLSVFALVLIVSSCEKLDEVLDYNGPVSVSFTSPTSTELFLFTGPGQILPATTTVDLIGSPQSGAITVNIAVDESSTAIEGVHYSLSANTVSIAAGEVSAALPLTAILDGFNGDPSNVQKLVLNISDASGAEIASNLSTITISMSITCPSDIPLGTYIETGTGTGGAARPSELTKNEDGTYTLSQMNFDFYSEGYDDIPGTFVDVCNTLTLQAVATDVFGIAWIGTGSYDSATGIITFAVSDQTYSPTYVSNMTFEKQ